MRFACLKLISGLLAATFLIGAWTGASARELTEQTSRDRGVAMRVKPVAISATAPSWAFEITFDTHSQELSDDLLRAAKLGSPGGAQHAPTAWEGDPPGGHHRKGVLRFAPIVPIPAALELTVQRSGESAPRRFKWQLK